MNKSLHPFIIFFWGYILFVRVQCRDTLGILNESKLSEHKELCFRRCDIGFQADDKETSSKEIFRRRSCYERCLREEGDMNLAKNELRSFADEQKMSLLKRIRRTVSKDNSGIRYGEENCTKGSTDSKTQVARDVRVVFRELDDTGRYQGTVTWKPPQNVSGNWTGYKIVTLYVPKGGKIILECEVVDKNVMQYSISNSSHGIENLSEVHVLVVSYPHSDNRVNFNEVFENNQRSCILSSGCDVEPAPPNTSTVPTAFPDQSHNAPPNTSTVPTALSDQSHNAPPNTSTVPTALSDQSHNDNGITPAIIAASVASCVFAMALLLAVVHCRRLKIYRPFSLVNPLTDLKFEFDAFIIYSSHDSEWVVKTLLPTLEEKHGLKCCVHCRDFTLGIPIRQNMVDSVYKCKKTVAVVSINFFNSNYCGSELDYALHRLMEKNDDSLVVIKIDDVDSNKLPKELQNRSYIDYPKSIENEVWEKKLINCLKVTS